MTDFVKTEGMDAVDAETLEWLNSVSVQVQQAAQAKASKGDSAPKATLPIIDMGRVARQIEGKSYPEMQGTIALMPVAYNGNRLTEIVNVYTMPWVPKNEDWSYGYSAKILPPQFYPENIRERIVGIRNRLKALLDAGKINFKNCKIGNATLMKGFVLNHKNTKGDLVTSKLFGGDQLVEHKNVPALVIFRNCKISEAIDLDLKSKNNPALIGVTCYNNKPLRERNGWVTIQFKSKTGAIGYDTKVTATPNTPFEGFPEGEIIPKDLDIENDERVKQLMEADPVYLYLDYNQRGPNGEYYTEKSLEQIESMVNFLENQDKK